MIIYNLSILNALVIHTFNLFLTLKTEKNHTTVKQSREEECERERAI